MLATLPSSAASGGKVKHHYYYTSNLKQDLKHLRLRIKGVF